MSVPSHPERKGSKQPSLRGMTDLPPFLLAIFKGAMGETGIRMNSGLKV